MQNAANTDVYLALGSNLGSPHEQLAAAVDALRMVGTVEVLSSVYRTAPVGLADQPEFLNMVCRISTSLPSGGVIRETSRIEDEMGRERRVPNGPRTIDIDVLSYGDEIVRTARLVIPHPRMHERAFVLVPLVEIAPGWRHPVLGDTAAQLLEAISPVEGISWIGSLGNGPGARA